MARPLRRTHRACALALVAAAAAFMVSQRALRPAHADGATSALGTTQSFVSCPVYRDTDMGRKSGCWLATDRASGITYDVSFAPIKPQHDHEVLVEGVVTGEPDVCGGVVLKPVRVAVLPGSCPSVKLPAAPYTGRPSPPPGEILRPAREPRTLPPPPYTERRFDIYFEHGRDFLIYQHAEVVLEKVQLYVQASGAKRVDIVGYAATEPLHVSGRSLTEDLALAEARAQITAEALRRLGVPDAILHLRWEGAPEPTELEGGRLPGPSKRRATLIVTP